MSSLRKFFLFASILVLVGLASHSFLGTNNTKNLKITKDKQQRPGEEEDWRKLEIEVEKKDEGPGGGPQIEKYRPDPGSVIVYDLEKPEPPMDIFCSFLSLYPRVPVCGYNSHDVMTNYFKKGIPWDWDVVKLMQEILKSDRDMGLIDIGAATGHFSLIAAGMGRKVLAVEPLITNAIRIHKGAIMGTSHKNIVLIQNAVSNVRGEQQMAVPSSNIAGATLRYKCNTYPSDRCETVKTILMNDLAHYATFRRAIMRIDIEGHEPEAFSESVQLLTLIEVPYILMKMETLRRMCLGWDRNMAFYAGTRYSQLFSLLKGWSYKGLNPVNNMEINYSLCQTWPNEVIWVKDGEPLPKDLIGQQNAVSGRPPSHGTRPTPRRMPRRNGF